MKNKILASLALSGVSFFGMAGCDDPRHSERLEGTVVEETMTPKNEYILDVKTERGIYRIQIEDMGEGHGGKRGNMSASLLDREIDKGRKIIFPLYVSRGSEDFTYDYFKGNRKSGIIDPDLIELVYDK